MARRDGGGSPPPNLPRRRGGFFHAPYGPSVGAHGGYTLLKRDDPALWLGSDDGAVVYGTVLPGGDFPEGECRRPLKVSEQNGVQGASPYRKTKERVLFRDGAMIQSAVAWPGSDVPLYAFVHPATHKTCVAGFDPHRRVWVVED